MFRIFSGKSKNIWFPVSPSTAMSRGSLVTVNTSGRVVAATATTDPVDILGVLDKDITASDPDYGRQRQVPVQVPIEKTTVWEADVTSGLVASDIGKEHDLTDAESVNRGESSVGVVKCVDVVSPTKGYFMVKINGSY